MLSQRFAKYAVLALPGDAQLKQRSASASDMSQSRAAFDTALTDLNGLPSEPNQCCALAVCIL